MKTRMMTMAMMAAAAFGAYAQQNASTNKPSVAGIILTPLHAAKQEKAAVEKIEGGAPVAAPEVKDQGPRVSISFDEAPLGDIIKAFRDATGANIITTSATTNLQGKVSATLIDVPWKEGLTSILQQQNLALSEQPPDSGIYTIVPQTIQAVPKFTDTFELQYAKADDVKKLFASILGNDGTASSFSSANVVIVTATELKLKECKRILEAIDKAPPQIYIEARFAELSASAARQLGLKWDSLQEWGGGIGETTLGYSNDRTHTSKKGGSGSTTTTGTRTTTATTTSTSSGNEGSSVSFSGTETPTTTVSMNNSHTFENALDYTRSRTFSTSLSADAFRLTLSAFEQMDGVQIFSNPKIIVSNERQALVDMTTKYPCVEVTSTRSGTEQNQLDITAKLTTIPGDKDKDQDARLADPFVGSAFFSYGISLSVTPRVSPNGLITVDIVPSISEVDSYYDVGVSSGSSSSSSPYSRYPIINMKRLITTFTMKSGTTTVIGGLSKTTENSTDSGIPGLRSIPWIGPHLFGWKSREKVQKEIVIFVTVGIVDPQDVPKDIGMPKNAVLGRDMMTSDGVIKEPGDQTREELMSLRDRRAGRKTQPAVSKNPAATSVEPASSVTPPATEVKKEEVSAPVVEKEPIKAVAKPAEAAKPVAVAPAAETKPAATVAPVAAAKPVEAAKPAAKATSAVKTSDGLAPVAVKPVQTAKASGEPKAASVKMPAGVTVKVAEPAAAKPSATVTVKPAAPAPAAAAKATPAAPAPTATVLKPVIPSEKNPVETPVSPLLSE